MIFSVNEVFYSIQGESRFAGYPCVMVRFSGCNLSCSYCDTAYACDEAEDWDFNRLMESIDQFQCPLVELTGGEPLLQTNIQFLTEQLILKGYRVLIETNGSCDINTISPKVTFIMDVKCPGSGHTNVFCEKNLSYIKTDDELKFVLSGRSDYDWAKNFISHYGLWDKVNILFSPVWNKLNIRDLATWMLSDRLYSARLQLQLHKLIWGPDKRGV
ncbi:MAG: radical SAM protein [Candidatus Auribacterota bacterium]